MNVFKPGQPIYIHTSVNETIHALILSVQVNAKEAIAYEVVWWTNGIRYVEWVKPHEISNIISTSKMKIGFKESLTKAQ